MEEPCHAKEEDDDELHTDFRNPCCTSIEAALGPGSVRGLKRRLDDDADAECAEVLSPPTKLARRRIEGMALHVKWQLGSSKTRVHCLSLQRVADADDLKVRQENAMVPGCIRNLHSSAVCGG